MCIICTCKCVHNLYLFVPVTCVCLNQVCAAYLTVTQHFIFPISSVITKAIYTTSCILLHADKPCLVSDQMIMNYLTLLSSQITEGAITAFLLSEVVAVYVHMSRKVLWRDAFYMFAALRALSENLLARNFMSKCCRCCQ
jgi:hypothetical protein